MNMDPAWYDLATMDHFWIQWRFAVYQKYAHQFLPQTSLALDVGCGHGVFMQQLHQAYGMHIDGCDIAQAALAKIPITLPGERINKNFLELDDAQIRQYDVIYLMDVLEHITDDLAILNKAHDAMQANALLVVNVPAGPYLYSSFDRQVGHVRRYSSKQLQDRFTSSGFQVLWMAPWGASLVPLALLRKVWSSLHHKDLTHAGFKPPNQFLNQLLQGVMKVEVGLPWHWGIGASLIAVVKPVHE